MEEGDLVWVNEGSEFAVCRVDGDWKADLDLDPQKKEDHDQNDIRNFREAEWKVVPYPVVPGFVKRRFAGRGYTLSKMHIGDKAKTITKHIFATDGFDDIEQEVVKSVSSKLDSEENAKSFLELLGPAEVEDVVLMSLQDKGWSVIKSTTSNSEAKIECELRRNDSDGIERAFLQVKSGKNRWR